MYYTRAGDQGKTCILGKGRIGKDELEIEALGSFDELNSALGVTEAFCTENATKQTLTNLQNDLHTLCAEISGGSQPKITARHITALEEAIKRVEAQIGEQRSFLLPGGTKQAALMHLTRAIARRAERNLVKLSRKTRFRKEPLIYANRLSTLLYVLARLQNKESGEKEKSPNYRYQ
ncbi:cob(I)yrinic acid a,c-diamide adenosyltransferase [Candidatus Woesearchaeota archaeon]|nr:cob(I)yrinic acid a,c-diamide adenosyltransferase [Candidatus Woesearchaeota archaeon]